VVAGLDGHGKITVTLKVVSAVTDTETARLDLAEMDRPALESALAERGQPRFRARQIFAWIYRRGVADPAAMTDLSKQLRAALAADFTLATPQLSPASGPSTARKSSF